MTYKTRRPSFGLGYLMLIPLCLAGANCGDPATGTWATTSAPAASKDQYANYMATLTFGDAKSVTVDLETTRSPGALVFAGCVESLMGSGTYVEAGTTITCTFESGTIARSNCVYANDNLTSKTIDPTNKDPKSVDAAAVATLVSLSSGSFVIANNALTLTSGSASIKYEKQQ